jgi:hypothetical protein
VIDSLTTWSIVFTFDTGTDLSTSFTTCRTEALKLDGSTLERTTSDMAGQRSCNDEK